MAAPVIAAVSGNKMGNTNADLAFNFASDGPLGIVAGSLLVAQISVNGTGATPVFDTPSSPDVWNKVQESIGAVGANRPGTALFWRIMTGSETGVTFTATPNSTLVPMIGNVFRVAGHDPANPINISSATAADTSVQTSYVLGGVTSTVPECLLLSCVAGSAASVRNFTNSGGLPEVYDFGVDLGANAMAQVCIHEVLAAVGASGTRTFTPNASAFHCGVAVAIQPPPLQSGWGEIPIN